MHEKKKKLQGIINDSLKILGIRNFLCGIHDPAFPSRPEEDTGRGSPYSECADDFLNLVSGLGFTGLQLGPQGKASLTNPSPYDGSLFSRNPLSLSLARLKSRYGAIPALKPVFSRCREQSLMPCAEANSGPRSTLSTGSCAANCM